MKIHIKERPVSIESLTLEIPVSPELAKGLTRIEDAADTYIGEDGINVRLDWDCTQDYSKKQRSVLRIIFELPDVDEFDMDS